MKIALFGATGKTGIQITRQALQLGYQVVAFVRNKSKLEPLDKNTNLKIVVCNLLKPDEIVPQLEGCDAVLSALGVPGFHMFSVSFYTDSMKSIVTAMRRANVKRLICISAFYVKYNPNYPLYYKFVIRTGVGRQLDDLYEMEDFLFKDCHDIDFTIVRPSRLSNDPLSDERILVNEDSYYFPDYSNRYHIPRADVGKFILECLAKNLYVKRGVAIDLPQVKT